MSKLKIHPHVLAMLFYHDGIDFALAQENLVREILRIRQEGSLICGGGQSDRECTPIEEIMDNASAIFYPPLGYSSDVFTARAEATVAGVRRTIEAVLDRKAGREPVLLSWRVL